MRNVIRAVLAASRLIAPSVNMIGVKTPFKPEPLVLRYEVVAI